MPKFRNIEQKEVISSIREAAKFLTGLNIGPESDKLIATLRDEETLAPLVSAKTDEAFVEAIRDSGIVGNNTALIHLGDVLKYHASLDTDGKALKIYENLSKWGALNGYDSGTGYAVYSEVKAHYDTLPPYGKLPGVPSPIGQYALKGKTFRLNGPEDNAIWAEDPEMNKILQQVIATLNPFFAKMEVVSAIDNNKPDIDYGISLDPKSIPEDPKSVSEFESNISFRATREAAQAVADALPEHTLINSNGEAIAPQQKAADDHATRHEKRQANGTQHSR